MKAFREWAGLACLWLLLVGITLAWRPLWPIDETRYLSVAWEMWNKNSLLVPILNGQPYAHKPPLLFWLIHLTWSLFGVNALSARFVAPVVGLLDLYLVQQLARLLWPGDVKTKQAVAWILLSFPLWAILLTLTMFDLLLAFFVLLAVSSYLFWTKDVFFGTGQQVVGRANTQLYLKQDKKSALLSCFHPVRLLALVMLVLAIAGGLLSKGPVIFVHILPLALLSPWWVGAGVEFPWRKWLLFLGAGFFLGIALALVWAVPAGIQGGGSYAQAIWWGQTAGRVVHSFAHRQPWWWYLPLLPIIIFPWSCYWPVWRELKHRWKDDSGVRFCLLWFFSALVVFSLISGKQIHYLAPLLPPLALLVAHLADCSRLNKRLLLLPLLALLFLLGVAVLLGIPLTAADLPRAVRSGLPWWGGCFCLISAVVYILYRKRQFVGVREVAVFMLGLWCLVQVGPLQSWVPAYDLSPASRVIAAIQTGREISCASLASGQFFNSFAVSRSGEECPGSDKAKGMVGVWPAKYAGQFQFLGRLETPLLVFASKKRLQHWLQSHPSAYLVLISNHPQKFIESMSCAAQKGEVRLLGRGTLLYKQPFRGRSLTIWSFAG